MSAPLDTDNPFTPGTSTMPLHVAGRESEQRVIAKALGLINKDRKDGILERSPMAPIKIIGPRGAGKSTLLVWTEQEAEKQDIHVVSCAELKEAKPGEGLTGLVSNMLGKYRMNNEFVVSLGIPDLASFKASSKVEAVRTYQNVLLALLEKTPVALLLDEAMHYDTDPFATVLQESQRLIGRRRPLVTIIAGTPSLDAHLRRVDATFINRAKKLRVNVISDKAVREALREPFKKYGVQVADDALELMASWTDNYPYFIQLAGEAVWDVMKAANRSEVDLSLAKEANEVMQDNRDIFYEDVYEDIRDGGLMSCARLVVDLVEGASEPLTPDQVVGMLEERIDKQHVEEKMSCAQIFNSLQDFGLVWVTNKRRVYAAIPSFFTYLKSEYKTQEG